MKRFARSRSERRASHPCPPAQCSVGSIDEDGIRYGLTTHALIASTIAIAPAIVTIQSIVMRHGLGRRQVRRSIGFRERRRGGRAGSAIVGSEDDTYGFGSYAGGGSYARESPSPASSCARRRGSESS